MLTVTRNVNHNVQCQRRGLAEVSKHCVGCKLIRKAYVERGLPKLIPAWKVTFKFLENDFVVLKVVGAP